MVQLRMLQSTAHELLKPQLMQGPPYDLLAVARALDVEVRDEPIAGAMGYVQRCDERYEVFVNATLSEEQKRFTLGHELGHVVLMRAAFDGLPVNLVRYRKTGCPPGIEEDPAEEALCNRFAAELLMPEWQVSELLREGGGTPRTIYDIKRSFRVSLHAAATRIVTLRETPRTSSISFWDCSTPWPTTRWWVGRRPESRVERDAIESLVSAVDLDRGSIDVVVKADREGRRSRRMPRAVHRTRVKMDVQILRDGRWMIVFIREAKALDSSRAAALPARLGPEDAPPAPALAGRGGKTSQRQLTFE